MAEAPDGAARQAVGGKAPAMSRDRSRGPDLHYGHPRMSVADRAKIFIPFNPLNGFTEALRAEEERLERELGDEG